MIRGIVSTSRYNICECRKLIRTIVWDMEMSFVDKSRLPFWVEEEGRQTCGLYFYLIA